MVKLESIFKDLIDGLQAPKSQVGDLGDVGNEVGIILAKYISKEIGFDQESLIAGIKHGISLVKGTH
jgi:hypothetical protein